MEIQPVVIESVRLTVPAREALVRAGNDVRQRKDEASVPPHQLREDMPPSLQRVTAPLYDVTVRRPPPGLELVSIGHGDHEHRGIRRVDEPKYPEEWPDGAVSWWEHGQLVPCPKCGAGLVWYEAGYVPGTRICLGGHGAQLSSDGRSAKPTRVTPPDKL